ncbi:MAG: hypothetical protein NZ518_02460 [Dehalococcoidia bacterium]|nr:hypothetical protein [Dehalococcoidia bacterium]
MSRLVEKLRAVARGEPPRLGFGTGPRTGKAPGIGLIADVGDDLALAKEASAVADAIIARVDESSVAATKDAIGGAICGVDVSACALPLDQATSLGLDFVVVNAHASADYVKASEADRLMRLPLDASDGMLQALSALAIDAVIPAVEVSGALTIANLLDFMRLVALTRKPIVLAVSTTFPSEQLVTLRDANVSGVVVALRCADDIETLKRFRQAIDSFPKPPKRERDVIALAPTAAPAAGRDDRSPAEPDDDEF